MKIRTWKVIGAVILLTALVCCRGRENQKLVDAVSLGELADVNKYLEQGADVNAKGASGLRPLHMAAIKGWPDVAELLIAKGADVNARDKYGWTPLRCSLDSDHIDVAELLKKHGAKK